MYSRVLLSTGQNGLRVLNSVHWKGSRMAAYGPMFGHWSLAEVCSSSVPAIDGLVGTEKQIFIFIKAFREIICESVGPLIANNYMGRHKPPNIVHQRIVINRHAKRTNFCAHWLLKTCVC